MSQCLVSDLKRKKWEGGNGLSHRGTEGQNSQRKELCYLRQADLKT